MDVEMSFPTAAPGFTHHDRKTRIGLDRWVRIRVPESADLKEEIRSWSRHEQVEVAECVPRVYPLAVPTDPLYPQQWQHDNTGANPSVPSGTPDADMDTEEAWDRQTGDVRVANLEATSWSHEDLVENVWQNSGEDHDGDGATVEWDPALSRWVLDPGDVNGVDDDGNGYVDDLIGWDFDDHDNVVDDRNPGHGTGTAGFFLAVPNNGKGIAGTCWGCQLVAAPGTGRIGEAMVYAADHGVQVINLSFRPGQFSIGFRDALEYVHGLGVVVVVGAGNDDFWVPNAYCDSEKTLCVGGTDSRDRIVTKGTTGGVWGSNYGPMLDVGAPAAHLTHLRGDGSYGTNGSGTSWAAPLAAGVAALVKSEDPSLSADEVISILQSTTDPFTAPSRFAGVGRVNAKRAVDAAALAAEWGSFPVAIIEASVSGIFEGERIEIHGTADSPAFSRYRVRIGEGLDPTRWIVDESSSMPVQSGPLLVYDVSDYEDSTVFLAELEVRDAHGQAAVDAYGPLVKLPVAHDLPGWPLTASEPFESPTLGAFERDHGYEVIVSRGDSLFAFGEDGTALPGWPVVGLDDVSTPPAVFDLDGYGGDEIVVFHGKRTSGPWWLTALEADGKTLPGWPVSLPAAPVEYPSIGDLDGDGRPEIVVFLTSDSLRTIAVFERDGSRKTGWPIDVASRFLGGPVLADVNGDGDVDLAAALVDGFHVFDESGSELPGWPWPDRTTGLAVAVDLDRDGRDEVVRAKLGNVYVHRESSAVATGWPVSLSDDVQELLAADTDLDGIPEILVLTWGGELTAIEADGTVAAGWPRQLGRGARLYGAANVDGDASLEVITGYRSEVWARTVDGHAGRAWPIRTDGNHSITSVVVGDVNGDGRSEMIVAERGGGFPPPGALHLYDRGGSGAIGDWPQRHRDGANTRRLSRPGPTSHPVDTAFVFEPSAPNPSATEVRLRWVQPGFVRTRLRVYDVTGRLVTTLVNADLPSGEHSVVWKMRNAANRPVVPGVYFVRLDAPPHSATQKIVSGAR
jgi:hypothetical protein